jgi:hypothetical protein
MREGEAGAAGSQAIEVRRLGSTAVGPERVGAQCVDGDEQDVLIGARLQDESAAARPIVRDSGEASQNQYGREPE